MRISDWRSDVCSSALRARRRSPEAGCRPCNRSGVNPSRRRGSSCGGGKTGVPCVLPPLIAVATAAAVTVALAHHDGRAVFVFVNTNGHVADDVFVDRVLALKLRSEEHTSEVQSLMSTSYAVFCVKKKKQ